MGSVMRKDAFGSGRPFGVDGTGRSRRLGSVHQLSFVFFWLSILLGLVPFEIAGIEHDFVSRADLLKGEKRVGLSRVEKKSRRG